MKLSMMVLMVHRSYHRRSLDVFGEKFLPLPSPTIVAGVFREKAPPPETVTVTGVVAAVFQDEPSSEEQVKSSPRTKGDNNWI